MRDIVIPFCKIVRKLNTCPEKNLTLGKIMGCLLVAGLLWLNAGWAYADTLSLLHMDGPVGSTTFTDATGKTWSATGNVQISDTQAKWGQSAYFSGGYLTAGNVNDFSPGSSPFTIDFWIYPLNLPETNAYLVGRSYPNSGGTGGHGYDMRLDHGEILVVGVNNWTINIGTDGSDGNNYVTTNTWHHIALSATAENVYLFYDGILRGSSARSAISDGGNPFRIGFQMNFGGTAFSGYIDEFRYSDEALWTSDFVPPGSPVPIPSAFLLMGSGLLGLMGWRRLRKS